MRRYSAGSEVVGGYYWNAREWEIVTVQGEKGTLPGAVGAKYLKLPLLVMIAVAAVVSFGFVIFLPAIGFVLLAWTVAQKVRAALASVGQKSLSTVAFDVRPGHAFLDGTGNATNDTQGKEDAARPDSLEPLKDEIDRRRDDARK